VNDAYAAKGSSPELLTQKHDLQHQIDTILGKADKNYKLPRDMWCESWSGFTGSTPCSDGEYIYFTTIIGVTACYDLNGNLKWQRMESVAPYGGGYEHGNGYSPALSGDKFIVAEYPNVYKEGARALNKHTGKDEWVFKRNPKNDSEDRDQLAVVTFSLNGADYVIARANVLRVSDGKPFYKLPWIFSAPVVHDDMIFSVHQGGGGYIHKLDPAPNNEIAGRWIVDGGWADQFRFPVDPGGNQYDPLWNFWTASPLYHDGLVYCLSNWGKLVVYDAKATSPKDALVYQKNLPFDFKNPKHRKTHGCGIGASPCFAGKYIYMIDNAGCMIVIEPGREYKQVAKNNLDHIMVTGWEQNHYNDHYHEVTLSTPIFEGNRIYVRAEQYLYCIGEK
jgi:hypothetical protein